VPTPFGAEGKIKDVRVREPLGRYCCRLGNGAAVWKEIKLYVFYEADGVGRDARAVAGKAQFFLGSSLDADV